MINRLASLVSAIILLIGALVAQPGPAGAQQKPKSEAHLSFETFDKASDQNAIIKLFRNNPGEVAFIMDSYLEGALALFEQAGHAENDQIEALFAHGLRAAFAADEAFGRRIFSDYASSFAGWDDAQKKQFRSGQAFYGEARTALEEQRYEDAIIAAEGSFGAADPLGDWWGVAVSLAVIGTAQEQLNRKQEALNAYSRARLLFQNFGMMDDLLSTEVAMTRLLKELGRAPRAQATANSAEKLAIILGNKNAEKEIAKLKEGL